LNSILFNEVLDRKLEALEERFRDILEKCLETSLEKKIAVTSAGPRPFEFKEFRAQLSGEVVFASMIATEGGPGRTLFALPKETAGMLGDLLLMGDGKTPFSYEEHLEPLRDFLKEVMSTFSGDTSKDLGHRVAFDEIKVSLVDLTHTDFVGTAWLMNSLEIGLDVPQKVFRIVSQDFYHACFPDTDTHVEAADSGGMEEPEEIDRNSEMGLVLDIELPISIELGRTSMLIRDIVKLAPGSVVELDKLSGEPVDLLVNGKLFARGEVVVVDENFAVRVTELVAPSEYGRIRSN
jgi:flagellar motor switch protein FliN